MTEVQVAARYAARSGPFAATRRASTQIDFDALLRSHHTTERWPATVATVDQLADKALVLVPGLSNQGQRIPGLKRMLRHLEEHPGSTWQERWTAAGHEADHKLWTSIPGTKQMTTHGLHLLLVLGAVRPSYAWLKANQFKTWYQILSLRDGGEYEQLEAVFPRFGKSHYDNRAAVVVLAHIACRTGKQPLEIDGDDLLAYQGAMRALRGEGTKVKVAGAHHAWDCLRAMGSINHPAETLRLAQLPGQLTVTELVDRHGIASPQMREFLIRYLRAREGALDYSTLRSLSAGLCGLFWRDVELHNPGIDSLRLSEDVADAWKRRLSQKADGSERRGRFNVMMQVRAMYLDIANWALTESYWVQWVAPSPVTDSDVAGNGKHQREAKARSHQRTRERAPEVDRLLRATEERLRLTTRWMADIAPVPFGTVVEFQGVPCRRLGRGQVVLRPLHAEGQAEDVNITRREDEAFWAWATVHLLHQTGLRIEELLELDQFSIQRFKHPQTHEVIPLLHVYPSKGGTERLLAASPELVHVLARIVHRLRQPDGSLPLTVRWDPHERTATLAAPLLFQRRQSRWNALSYGYIYSLMDKAGDWAGLRRTDGKPLKFRPHDLRRIFATDAQSSGVPIHVIAALLGHDSIETTAVYAAVYEEDVIRGHRNFIAQRRASAPQPEQRDITDSEWEEFQQHFVERKLSLGSCGRAWGSSCVHEHACVRCSLLRPDPAVLHRFEEIRDNLRLRIEEARTNGWLGEVEGLEVSLLAAEDKIRRMTELSESPEEPTYLGLPAIRPLP
ncbi:site-specific integrase [Nocardioides sp.]|uniref:tyrosine-type recombinase/integrase n=1 Tax=Nocardioides sp. TaxID=35761 RepID=UPI002BEB5E96|nr:site-specific integrase [Nocardioides sp.]HXH81133.1 site-specific integrase [Nocardioides sp.]